jgi:chemotaxis response regulator CheB
VPALKTIFKGLPPGFPVPVAAVLHRTRREPHNLAGLLGRGVRLRVKLTEQGEQPQPVKRTAQRGARLRVATPSRPR